MGLVNLVDLLLLLLPVCQGSQDAQVNLLGLVTLEFLVCLVDPCNDMYVLFRKGLGLLILQNVFTILYKC